MVALSDGVARPMCEPSAAIVCSTRRPVTGGLVTRAVSYSRSRHPDLRAMSPNVLPGRAARGGSRKRARPTGPAARSSATNTSAGTGIRRQASVMPQPST